MEKVKNKLDIVADKLKKKLTEYKQKKHSGEITFKLITKDGGVTRIEFFTKETL